MNIIVFDSGITQPKDKGILLKDIIETGITEKEKSYCIDANYAKGGNEKNYIDKSRRQLIITDGAFRGRNKENPSNRMAGIETEQILEINETGKSNCISTVGKDSLCIEKIENDIIWRKLTPIECERLQTVPDNYTSCVSNTRRYHALGNGWTVDVIAHIFSFIK